jgi:hypothetical protein
MVATKGDRKVVCEIENRGARSFIIGVDEHISGGDVRIDTSTKQPRNVYINPDARVIVTEEGYNKLAGSKEIRLIRKSTRKE